MAKYLILDSETGGKDQNPGSLLTLTTIVADAQLQKLEQLELTMKPDDGYYRVCESALTVNKIDLREHLKTAISYREATSKLKFFLSKHINNGSKLVPVGHNLPFDLKFIHEYLMPREEWEDYCDYRVLDTAVIGAFLKLCLIIPPSVSGSLGSLSKFFGVEEPGAHNATVDARMTQNLLRAMKFRVTKG